jgi:hypothetical protein
MKTHQRIASLLPTGGLGLLLLLLVGGCAADDEGRQRSKTSFGKVIKRQLLAPSFVAIEQVVLNLDTGELLSVPTNTYLVYLNHPRSLLNWMVRHGADLLVHGDRGTSLGFYLDDGRLALLGRDVTFETIAAPDVERELARAGVFQSLEVPKPEKGRGAALVFRTREGGSGVMQLLEFRAKPEPVLRLRYKLVRHGSVAGGLSPERR